MAALVPLLWGRPRDQAWTIKGPRIGQGGGVVQAEPMTASPGMFAGTTGNKFPFLRED